MTDWKRWFFPGLAALVILTTAAGLTRLGPVEADLEDRSLELLHSQHAWVRTRANGRDLVLAGTAPSEQAIGEALQQLRQLRGVRTASSGADLLARQSPYTLRITRSDGKLLLEGFVPGENARETIRALAGASVPGAAIEDRLQLASGAPENFIPLVGYATAQLAGLKEGGIEFEDSSLSVYGQAESSIAYENVLDAMAATLPGAQLRRLEVEPPLASPFAWSLSRRDGLVTLDGHAPSRAKRDTIAADIRNAMSGTQIDNRLSIARGLPQDVDWTPATAHLARLLAEMATGTITVSDGMVSVDGDAASPQAFETVNAALDRELPAGLRLASAQIRRPVVEPYVWAIETAKGGAVTLSGYAPAPDTASRLAETVRGIVGEDGGFRDGQQIASGAPEGFEAAASATRFALGRLPDMRASLTGKTLRVEGEALTGTAANEIRSLIAAALPEGYALDAAIAIRPPGTSIDASACHAELAGQLQRASVRFETGSADISTRSLGLLDSLAFTLRRCPETRFEVGGHTDSDGIEEANLELSTARARAIADWLIRSGVRYSRLVAKGYGESRPVADNATPEGKARNRRIEFRVLQ